MYYYLKDGDPEIDGMMASVCAMGGGGTCVTDARLRFRRYPETDARAAESLKTAKRTPRSRKTRYVKTKLYGLQYNWFRNLFANDPTAVAVAWNGLTGTRRAFMAAARDAGRPRIFLERSPLPGRVTVDETGINQLNGLPRDMAFYRDWAGDDPDRTGRGWMHLKEALTARKSRRADVTQVEGGADLSARNFLFCPLQVPDDTQIRQFGGWVKDINRFLDVMECCAHWLPEGWHLRLKEHPSSKIPLGEYLETMKAALPDKIEIDNSTDTFAQVTASKGVITLNSSVGLQAFFFDKPVLLLGQAFFRAPGLVTPVDSVSELSRVFEHVDDLSFDPAMRNVFMNYLDQVYYPKVVTGQDGRVEVAPDLVLPKLEHARVVAGE